MAKYEKPWLSVDEQIDRLSSQGVTIQDRDRAASILHAVGYYRLTGYLYPYRESEHSTDEQGHARVQVLAAYRQGTTLQHADDIINFDRRLRMLVMDGIERFEVAVRMQVGYALGKRSPFAYEDPAVFTTSFVNQRTDVRDPGPSKHVEWLQKVNERRSRSDERFVEHFREKYEDRMPVWALTEILELGQLSGLYRGMNQQDAEEIATAFGVPTKKIMSSWLASLNYVRNVAAHHSRLFNRKLQNAPSRPKVGQIPLLDHLRGSENAKGVFGTYNALAVIAYVLTSIDPEADWTQRTSALLREFPTTHALSIESMGAPTDWESLKLWKP